MPFEFPKLHCKTTWVFDYIIMRLFKIGNVASRFTALNAVKSEVIYKRHLDIIVVYIYAYINCCFDFAMEIPQGVT
jgi:hypothetical protein